jgi:hypothetical protein
MKSMKSVKKLFQVIQSSPMGKYKEIIAIVILATLLRTWNLNTQMIFLGDAARDLLTAATSVQTQQLPLLGSLSTIANLQQGPLTLWIEMVLFSLFGHNLLIFGFFFALFSVLAIVFLFELLTVFVHRLTAIIGAILLTVFPLAVAHGRTPYRTTMVPFFTVMYFFGLMQLWRKKKYGLFWAIISFCLLFQFEVATFPLVLLVPYILWKQGRLTPKKLLSFHWRRHKAHLLQTLAAVVLGLSPQIIYDTTHGFRHIGSFVAWKLTHLISFSQISTLFTNIETAFIRMWAGEHFILFTLMLVLFVYGMVVILRRLRNGYMVSPVVELTSIAVIIQLAGYVFHGGPTDAYMPVFFILSAIILASVLTSFIQHKKVIITWLVILFLGFYGMVNVWQTVQHQFFVDSSFDFNYGCGLGEQRQIVSILLAKTKGKLALYTTDEEGKYPSYLDNFRWHLAEKQITEDKYVGQPVFIEPKDVEFPKIVSYIMVPFPSKNVYFLETGL